MGILIAHSLHETLDGDLQIPDPRFESGRRLQCPPAGPPIHEESGGDRNPLPGRGGPRRGVVARGVGVSIFTQAATLEELREAVRDAVRCHFDGASRPRLIRLHRVHDEVIAA